METCATDHNGYDAAECDLAGLDAIEPTLPERGPKARSQ